MADILTRDSYKVAVVQQPETSLADDVKATARAVDANPDLDRYMAKRAGSTTVEINGSHAAFIARPADVAKVIEQAAAKAGEQ